MTLTTEVPERRANDLRRDTATLEVTMQFQSTCSIPSCAKAAARAGMCWMHYKRIQRHGDANHEQTEAARFWSHVEKTETCWLWLGAATASGYGKLSRGNWREGTSRSYRAHRYAYTLLRGEIPEGADLDHLCGNKRCVNPDHLEPVTRGENTRRAGPVKDARGRYVRFEGGSR